MKKVFYFTVIIVLLSACSKTILPTEEITVDEHSNNWIMHEQYRYNYAIQTNSVAKNDTLFILGHNGISHLYQIQNDSQTTNQYNVLLYANNYFFGPSSAKMPISANYYAAISRDGSSVIIAPTNNPLSFEAAASISLRDVDPLFRNLRLLNYVSSESMSFNGNNQVLIPYVGSENIGQLGGFSYSKFLLMDLTLNNDFDRPSVEITKTKVISIPQGHSITTQALRNIGNDFFVLVGGDYVYRIDTEGNIETIYEYDRKTSPVNDGIYNIIKQGNTLYGIGLSHLFISADQGSTWEVVSNVPTEFRHLNYTHIGQTLVAYRNSQIWEITLSQDNVQARELDREGLEGKMITSVTEFDDQIFVTTLSGVFSKDKNHFFDDRR